MAIPGQYNNEIHSHMLLLLFRNRERLKQTTMSLMLSLDPLISKIPRDKVHDITFHT